MDAAREDSMQGRNWFGVPAFLGAILAMGLGIGSAAGDQQQWASQYVEWTPDGAVTEIYNIDQVVWIAKPNQTSFWPLQWDFKDYAGGGYLGLQQGATPATQNVRFSIWDATKARGRACRPFDGEGVGQTCTLSVKIDPAKFYRLRLWRLEGRWWGAWLIETDRNGALKQRLIGKIRAPVATAPDPASVTNFVEYFGDSFAACRNIPLSIVGLTPPALNYQGSGVYQGHYSYAGSTKADGNLCETGSEGNGALISAKRRNFGFARGVAMFLGLTLDRHRLPSTLYPTPPQLPDQ